MRIQMVILLSIALTAVDCGRISKKSTNVTPPPAVGETPSPDESRPDPKDGDGKIVPPDNQKPDEVRRSSIPLSAGFSVVSKLSDADGCHPSFTTTVNNMLYKPGEFSGLDMVGYEPDGLGLSVTVKIYRSGLMTNFFTINGSESSIAAIKENLESGAVVSITKQAVCAVSTGSDPVYAIGYFAPETSESGGATMRTLQLQPQPVGAPANFDVSYGYGLENFGWTIAYTTTIDDAARALVPEQIRYAIYNKSAAAFIGDWQATSRDALKSGSFRIVDPIILKRLLPQQLNLEIIFDIELASSLGKVRYILPIGDFCRSFLPRYFTDQTIPGSRCFGVKESQLPQ
jgi:hypothetical protein